MTDDLVLRVVRKMLAVGPILQRGFESRFQIDHDDMTMIQLRALALLSAGPMTISELARLRQVSLQTASEMVKNFEEHNWVERYRNPNDRRQWLISLTHAGLQQLEAAHNFAVTQMIPHLHQLTNEEMESIEIALDALRRVFAVPDISRNNAAEEKDAS